MIISYHANNHLVVKPWRKLLVTATRWRSHVHQGFALNRWETTVVSFYFQNFLSQIFVNFCKQFFCRLCRNIYSCEIFSNSSKYLSLSTRRGPQTVYGSAASCRAFCKPDTCHYAVMNINKHFKKKHWLDFRDTLCKNIFLKPDLGDLVFPPCPLEIDFCKDMSGNLCLLMAWKGGYFNFEAGLAFLGESLNHKREVLVIFFRWAGKRLSWPCHPDLEQLQAHHGQRLGWVAVPVKNPKILALPRLSTVHKNKGISSQTTASFWTAIK